MSWISNGLRTTAAAALLAGLLPGCAVPDLQPFADSTALIHRAVLATDTDIPAWLEDAGQHEQAAAFAQHLAVRTQAMNAVLGYSESLAHITAAGQSGAQSAGAVADSLNGLLGAVKAAPLAGGAVSSLATAYDAIAQVRAASAFADAVQQADPAIQGIARILQEDLKSQESLLPQLVPLLKLSVVERDRSGHLAGLESYRLALERRRRSIEKQLAATPGDPALIRESQDVALLIEQTRDRYEPVLAERREIEAQVRRQVELMRRTRQALIEWAAVHAGLAGAVRAGLRPNTAVLTSMAVQLLSAGK